MSVFTHKQIILGVTGSIACYKAAYLASRLTQAGAMVDVILTQAAQKFILPLTFQSVTGRRVYTDEALWGAEGHVLHVSLAKKADLILIAPVTAHSIAKLAQGQADNLLSLTVLSAGTTRPLLLAPAMDGQMFHHPATQENLNRLHQQGAMILGPEMGHLASGLVATGRMSEPEQIFRYIRYQFSRSGELRGRKLVVTAGGTQEPIDPVRIITNHSSGKQGVAIAQAALDAGADVTLISPALHLEIPYGATHLLTPTAQQMQEAVLAACQTADALVMAAAVADFRPVNPANHKLKKDAGTPTILLEPNPDILQAVHQQKRDFGYPKMTIGFAAETQDLVRHAQSKLQRKGLDLIVANDVSANDAGFGVDSNRVTLIFADGRQESLQLMSKTAIANYLVQHLALFLGESL